VAERLATNCENLGLTLGYAMVGSYYLYEFLTVTLAQNNNKPHHRIER